MQIISFETTEKAFQRKICIKEDSKDLRNKQEK